MYGRRTMRIVALALVGTAVAWGAFLRPRGAEAACRCSTLGECTYASQCYSDRACRSGQRCDWCAWADDVSCPGGGSGGEDGPLYQSY